MNRRGFLTSLGAAAAAFALDPERALWVPGAKTISIPAVRVVLAPPFLALGDIVTFGDWPEPYVVMQAAQSLAEIGAARFKLHGNASYLNARARVEGARTHQLGAPNESGYRVLERHWPDHYGAHWDPLRIRHRSALPSS
jgi:hypothetical protein